jgi:hypothetical protein
MTFLITDDVIITKRNDINFTIKLELQVIYDIDMT